MAYQYPYGDTQQLNLAWFLDEFKALQEAWEQEKQGITGALDAEIARAEAALSGVIEARDQAAASAADALAYRNAAQSASQAAELSKTNAETARRDASNYAVSAAGSAQNASNSAIAAGNSATLAESAKTTAIQQANAAVQASGAASGYAQSAGQEAANAAASATAADGSATAAAGSATTAGEEADRAEAAADEVADSVTQIATNTSDISDLKTAITGNYEATSTASQAYSVGDYFWYNGKLYKAISSIAQGATFTPNTNCVEVTIGAELDYLTNTVTPETISESANNSSILYYILKNMQNTPDHTETYLARTFTVKGNTVKSRTAGSNTTPAMINITKTPKARSCASNMITVNDLFADDFASTTPFKNGLKTYLLYKAVISGATTIAFVAFKNSNDAVTDAVIKRNLPWVTNNGVHYIDITQEIAIYDQIAIYYYIANAAALNNKGTCYFELAYYPV